MLKNYLKIAWRNLMKNKGFTTINIVGLAIGMASVLLTILWVQDQFAYDNFYSTKKDIYKVLTKTKDGEKYYTNKIVSGPVASSIKSDYPEVLEAARIYWSQEKLITYADKKIKIKGNQVDESFSRIFDLPIVSGNKSNLLENEQSIALTKTISEAIFGNENPIGKTVILDDKTPFTVTAILEDLPSNTDFDFTFLIRLPAKEQYSSTWNTNTYNSFILLKPNTNIEDFNRKISGLYKKYAPEMPNTSAFLYPLSKMHLYSEFENAVAVGGKIEDVRLISIIGGIILIIACINFINLSTARSQKRAKEVGIRKVIGAQKKSLIIQFLFESQLVALMAGSLGLVLMLLFIPVLNNITEKPFNIQLDNLLLWLSLLALIIITGLMAGLYPAFILSSFKPIKTLKGVFSGRIKSFNFRASLVVFQFGIAVVLIIASIIVLMQIRHSADRNIGYETTQLIEIRIEGDIEKNYEVIKNEMISGQIASHIAKAGWTVTGDYSSTGGGIKWEGSTPESEKNFNVDLMRSDGGLIKTMKLNLIAGRDIDLVQIPADSNSIILNEAAIKYMGLKDPVGKQISWGNSPYTIVGVTENMIMGSPYEAINPMMMHASSTYLSNMVVRLNNSGSVKTNLENASKIFNKYNPNYPFSYNFVDEEFGKKFNEQQKTANLAMLFSGLAILISCLGLYGLAAYTAETKIKEIGIRKVLGASVLGITGLLSKEFLKLVGFSLIIGSPIAWYLMNKWLNNFYYRIEIQWWVFAMVAVLTLMIAFITVGYQAIKSASINPVKSLRDE